MTETSILKCSDFDYCSCGTNERKFVNKIMAYAEQYPDDVKIIKTNEDGYIYFHVPTNWFKFIGPPKKINLTEEQREARAERMRKLAKDKKKG